MSRPSALPAPEELPPAVTVRCTGPLRGRVRGPGDKSISHRALILAALASGSSALRGLSHGDDVARTAAALGALGAGLTSEDPTTLRIDGGRERLHPAPEALDCGNSGTGMRLLAGMASGFPWRTLLRGDASLSSRPMDRIAEPLRAMGALVEGQGPRCLPPLAVTGGPLRGIDYTVPVASAQVKSAVLLAGLSAEGETVVREAVATRSHTEDMLADAGAAVDVQRWGGTGRVVRLRRSSLRPVDRTVPGDPSQAAFWIVAGCLVPGSEVTVEAVHAGPERTGFLGVLARMGARVQVDRRPGGTVDLTAASGPLRGTVVEAAEIPSLDEVPILAVAAAAASGTTVFRDAGELRVKEVDRMAATATLVRAFGAEADVVGDDLRVRGVGPGPLAPGRFHSAGDHRLAMAAVVAGLAAGPGPTRIDGFGCVATSYPGFLEDLTELAGRHAATPERSTDAGPGAEGEAGRRVVAVDGPAGSGKSTLSRALAEHLGVDRLDTGAMYRAVAWAALEAGVDLHDAPAVAAIARVSRLEVEGDVVRIDGHDVTGAIRTPPVNRAVSSVAANPEVRRSLVALQRAWAARHGGGVVEGRDIGTVVFPDARLKVFLTASPEERQRRRPEEPSTGLDRRDHLDTTRAASPLAVAEGALVVDTTGRSAAEVLATVLSWM